MSKFTFEPKTHSYKLDGRPLTGVTTIIGVLDKPALVQWSANMACDYIEKAEEVTPKVIKEARTAWRRKRDKAGDIGTRIHDAIEEYVKAKIKDEPEPVLELTEHEQKMFDKFKEWEEDNDVTFLLSEQKLYSEKHWFAGTVDLVVEVDGKIYVADIKTGKDIYVGNYIQMGGYEVALEELGKIKDCAGYIVVNLPKQLKKNGEARFKEGRVHNTKDFKEAFLHCLALYRFLNKEKPAYLKKKGTQKINNDDKKVVKI